MHISGWYNRVQVANEKWAEAAEELGVNKDNCGEGVYPEDVK